MRVRKARSRDVEAIVTERILQGLTLIQAFFCLLLGILGILIPKSYDMFFNLRTETGRAKSSLVLIRLGGGALCLIGFFPLDIILRKKIRDSVISLNFIYFSFLLFLIMFLHTFSNGLQVMRGGIPGSILICIITGFATAYFVMLFRLQFYVFWRLEKIIYSLKNRILGKLILLLLGLYILYFAFLTNFLHQPSLQLEELMSFESRTHLVAIGQQVLGPACVYYRNELESGETISNCPTEKLEPIIYFCWTSVTCSDSMLQSNVECEWRVRAEKICSDRFFVSSTKCGCIRRNGTFPGPIEKPFERPPLDQVIYQQQGPLSIYDLKEAKVGERIALICYVIPSQVWTFVTMIGGSWAHVAPLHPRHIIDLLVFCSNCDELSRFIPRLNAESPFSKVRMFETTAYDIAYKFINSFAFMNHPRISEILHPYDWIMRTDVDVWLGPNLVPWIQELYVGAFGKGGHALDKWTRLHLREIAPKYNATHKGIHHVGSTWVLRNEDFLPLCSRTVTLQKLIYANEFDEKVSGKPNEWPVWFDGVTSMYAGEITLNDYFTTNELSDMQLQGESLDFGSDKYDLVGSQIHMHSWHGQLVNEKYTLHRNFKEILKVREDSELSRFILDTDVTKESTRIYCHILSQRSIWKYWDRSHDSGKTTTIRDKVKKEKGRGAPIDSR